jgi:hypothetical protein
MRPDLRLLSLLLLLGAAANAGAQCLGSDNTKVVHVFFTCTGVPEEVTVTIGGEPVKVTKKAGASYWRGETSLPFQISTRALNGVAMTSFRVPCKVQPASYQPANGPCAAKYVVNCEPLFQLKVMAVPGDVAATITYERQKTQGAIESCDLKGEKTTPALLALGSEKLRVSAKSSTGAPMAAELSRELFEAVAERKMSEFTPFISNTRSTVPRSRAAAKVRELTLQNILFIRQ